MKVYVVVWGVYYSGSGGESVLGVFKEKMMAVQYVEDHIDNFPRQTKWVSSRPSFWNSGHFGLEEGMHTLEILEFELQ